MAKLELNISAPQKRRFKKYSEEHGDEALGHLIDKTKEADQLELELQDTAAREKKLEKEIEKLKKNLNAQKEPEAAKPQPSAPAVSDPSAMKVLIQALESMKQINESYARENERLLKITNFSEYDERIMKLNREIGSFKSSLETRGDKLKQACETISGLEAKGREQADNIRELNTFLEDARNQTENRKKDLLTADAKITARDDSIARHRAELAKKEAEIEELKKRADMLQAEVSTMAVAAQNSSKSEDHLHG